MMLTPTLGSVPAQHGARGHRHLWLEGTVPKITCFPKIFEAPSLSLPRDNRLLLLKPPGWCLRAFMSCVFNITLEYLPYKFLRADL